MDFEYSVRGKLFTCGDFNFVKKDYF